MKLESKRCKFSHFPALNNNPSLGISNSKSIASPKSNVRMAVGENPANNAGLKLKGSSMRGPKVRTQAVAHSAFGLGPMPGDSVIEDVGANGGQQGKNCRRNRNPV